GGGGRGGRGGGIPRKPPGGGNWGGVDEDGDEAAWRAPARPPHQREMPARERAWGWYQRDPLTRHSPPHGGAAQRRHRAHDSNGHRDGLRVIGLAARRANYQSRGGEATCRRSMSRCAQGAGGAGIAPEAGYGHLWGGGICRP